MCCTYKLTRLYPYPVSWMILIDSAVSIHFPEHLAIPSKIGNPSTGSQKRTIANNNTFHLREIGSETINAINDIHCWIEAWIVQLCPYPIDHLWMTEKPHLLLKDGVDGYERCAVIWRWWWWGKYHLLYKMSYCMAGHTLLHSPPPSGMLQETLALQWHIIPVITIIFIIIIIITIAWILFIVIYSH